VLFSIKEREREIFNLLASTAREMECPTYVVGGYVRDRLMGRTSGDIDVVCVGSGIDLATKFAQKLIPIPKVAVYKRFGTAMLKYKGIEIEFVGARKESYRSDSRKPVVENGSLVDDQQRRDFTINALAVSLNDNSFGEIIDPFGGINHIEQKIIITPLEPGQTFSDDPLRMLRAIRFATQLDFKINPTTFQGIIQNRARIHIVSRERITIELEKILASPVPSVGFKLLFDAGLLKLIFPELQDLHGVEYTKGKGHKDNFYHTLEVLDNVARVSDNIWLRWSALLHDIAKPATKRFDPQVGWTFHGHEALGAAMVPRIFRKMRLPMDHKMKFVKKLVRLHLRPIALTKSDITDSALRRLIFEAGDDLEDLLTLCEADITSKNENRVQRYLENYALVRKRLAEVEEKDKLKNWQPPITGETIMETFDIPPSRVVGDIKTKIREAILDGEIPNDYEDAYDFMLVIGEEFGLKKSN